jgi:hypothetical protein
LRNAHFFHQIVCYLACKYFPLHMVSLFFIDSFLT